MTDERYSRDERIFWADAFCAMLYGDPELRPVNAAAYADEALDAYRERFGIRPDEAEPYTPEWAAQELGASLRLRSVQDGWDRSVVVSWRCGSATLCTGWQTAIIAMPTRGAARRLVAALRECYGEAR